MARCVLHDRAYGSDGGGLMDVRLKTMPYEIDGHKLTLSCNMDVLAELQAQDSNLGQLLDGDRSMRNYLRLMAAMINSELRRQGVDAAYTDGDLGRRISFREFRKNNHAVFAMLVSAVIVDDPEEAEPKTEQPEADEKNAVTSKDDGTASTLPGT